MNINFTLIVQSIHFLIAYLILRFFLFKPARAQIVHEKKIENDLRVKIDESKQLVALLEKENKDQWRLSQLEFSQKMPLATSSQLYIFKNVSPAITAPIIDAGILQASQEKLTHLIVDKVGHV